MNDLSEEEEWRIVYKAIAVGESCKNKHQRVSGRRYYKLARSRLGKGLKADYMTARLTVPLDLLSYEATL